MAALPVPVSDPLKLKSRPQPEINVRRRINYEFYEQLDYYDPSALPDYITDVVEGAD